MSSVNIRRAVILSAAIALIWSVEGRASGPAGIITRVDGKATVQRNGNPNPIAAEVGMETLEGDSIRTGKGSKVKMLMADGTILDIGPTSQFDIKEYFYNPTVRANYRLVYGRGRAKVPHSRKPPNVRFTTPTAVAGVRGTDLILEYDPQSGRTRIIAITGTIVVVNPNAPGQEIILTPGMTTFVGTGIAPTPPLPIPELEIQNLMEGIQPGTNSPGKIIKLSLPGSKGSDIKGAVPPNLPTGGGKGRKGRGEGGNIISSPQDLIDQEPPPFTPVIINIRLI